MHLSAKSIELSTRSLLLRTTVWRGFCAFQVFLINYYFFLISFYNSLLSFSNISLSLSSVFLYYYISFLFFLHSFPYFFFYPFFIYLSIYILFKMETCDKTKLSKRKFVEAWLNDDRYKSWIRKIASDNTKYYCDICHKSFLCSSSHVSRHADSACHKNKLKEKKDIRTFRPQWLDVTEFKPWLCEMPNNVAFCSLCERAIAGGLSQLYRHAESKIHRERIEKSAEANKCNKYLDTQMDESLLSFDERKKSAEIKYAALIAEKNIPHRTAKEILHFFQQIEDPNVLKKMRMSPRKCKNIISNVLCPVKTDRVVNSIQNTKFSVFIDETSDVTNEKWMAFIVRYVDFETKEVRTQLIKLIDVDARDCSAEKLFNAFQSEMYKLQIPFTNILALSCDNASVMTGKHLSFKKKLEEKCKHLLTFACPCHSAALVAHAACAKMPEFCEEFLRKIVNYINSSPKRSAIFKEFCDCFQDTNRKLLKLCDTRWLSHYTCVDRILESWNSIKYFLNEIVVSEKTKSGENLLSLMNNIDIKAYFLFLKYILNLFNTFNAFFQAQETRIHLLHSKSVNFLVQITQNFLKPELLKDILTNITFSEQNNHKAINDINLGTECEEYLHKLIKDGHTDVVSNVRENCLQFYVIAAEEIRKRLPVNNIFLYKLHIFQPQVALFDSNKETSFNDVSFIAKIISGFDESGLKEEWFALYNDFNNEEKQNLSTLNFDNMWKEILKSQLNNIAKYPNLTTLLNAIRALPNSNADPERIFSMLNDIKTKKRNKLSAATINATCVFKSALKTRGETALAMRVSEKHLSLMSTSTLYAIRSKKSINILKLYAADSVDPSSSNAQQ